MAGGATLLTVNYLTCLRLRLTGRYGDLSAYPDLMTMSHPDYNCWCAAGSQTLSGKQIATELTNEINKAFGDDKQFDLSNAVYGKL